MALTPGATFSVSFAGVDNSGGGVPVSVPGLKVGDLLLKAFDVNEGSPTSNFEQTVTVDDQLQQAAGDESAQTFTAVFFRPIS